MKPELYAEYHKFYDLFSSPELFPSLLTFCRKIARHAPEGARFIADIGAGTGLFTQHLQKHFTRARFTVVEPSEYMMPYVRKRLDAKRTDFYQCRFDQCTDIAPQDVVIFQRSLYAFSGDPGYFRKLASTLFDLLNPGGLLAIYEIGQTYDIDELRQYMHANITKTPLSKTQFEKLWPIFEKTLISFNENVAGGQYTLFNKDNLTAVFSGYFNLVASDEVNSFLFRKIAK